MYHLPISVKKKEIGDAYVKSGYFIQDFWKDNRRFADLFNTVLYDGKQVILPEKLMEADSNLSGSIQTKRRKMSLLKRRADLIRKFAGDSEYAIFPAGKSKPYPLWDAFAGNDV